MRSVAEKNSILLCSHARFPAHLLFVFFFFIYIQITFLFREGHEKMLDSLFCENDYFPSVLFVENKNCGFHKAGEEENALSNTKCKEEGKKKELRRRFNSEMSFRFQNFGRGHKITYRTGNPLTDIYMHFHWERKRRCIKYLSCYLLMLISTAFAVDANIYDAYSASANKTAG